MKRVGQPKPLLQFAQRLRIWAWIDVERRHRFVGDDDIRDEGERPRDDDALPLAAGEGVRIARGVLGFSPVCSSSSMTRAQILFLSRQP